jgi:hypothetical protein
MGPYAGVDYNLTFCPLQSQLQHIYHGQPNARVGLNPMPESALSPSQVLRIWPQYLPQPCHSQQDEGIAHNAHHIGHRVHQQGPWIEFFRFLCFS